MPSTPPKDLAELDDLIEDICDVWEASADDGKSPTRAAYLRRRLAEHGVQLVPEHWARWRGLEEGPERSPYYTAPIP